MPVTQGISPRPVIGSADHTRELPHSAWLRRQAPKWLAPAAGSLAVAEALAIIGQAALLAWLIHAAVIDGRGPAELTTPLIALALVFVLRAVLTRLRGALTARASADARVRLRRDLFGAISRGGPALVQRAGTGARVTALVDQVEVLDAYYARFLPQLLAAGLIPLFIVIAVVSRNWLAGLLLALTAPIIPLFMALVGMGAEQLSQNQQGALARLSGLFHDRLRGLDTIRQLRAGERERARLAAYSDEFRQRTMSVLRLAFLSSAVLEFFAAVAVASLAIYVGLALLGAIDFGPAAALTLNSGLFIFTPLRQLAQHWHDRADALAAADTLRPLLAQKPARPDPQTPAGDLPGAPCRIDIRNLGFSYPGRETVFSSLELRIEAGEHVVISGTSGSGKTTLISLLAGFLSADSGHILFDNIDLDRLTSHQLADCRAWLGQNPVLFAGTLGENIALGKPEATREELIRAARAAGASDFIEALPAGLDTALGQDGGGLSGGQAQRIALARALLRPRGLLLLDEPTARLDADSERAVWRAIAAIRHQYSMTVVTASHSALAREQADRVINLDDLSAAPGPA